MVYAMRSYSHVWPLAVPSSDMRRRHIHCAHVRHFASFINGSRAGLLLGGCDVVVAGVAVVLVADVFVCVSLCLSLLSSSAFLVLVAGWQMLQSLHSSL